MNYLNTKDVSVLLNCSQKTVQKHIATGKLIPINPNHSKGFLFKKQKIEELAKKRKEAVNA